MLILSLIFFAVASVVCFTIPGLFLLSKTKLELNFWEKLISSTILGFVSLTLISYISLVLRLEILLILVVILFNVLGFKQALKLKDEFFLPNKSKFWLIGLVFLLGVVGQLAIISPSGLSFNQNLVFWSSHGHDGPWHIALMEEIKKGYPFQNPVFAGERLVNYHFFSDLIPAFFSKFLFFSNLDLYFRFFPLLYSLLFGAISFMLGSRLGKSFWAGLLSCSFCYFAGSFGWILFLIQGRGLGGESVFWVSQPQSTIGNPPQIAAFIILLFVLYLFSFSLKKDIVLKLILIILAGSLIVFKVYGGILLLAGLAVISLWQIIKERSIDNLLVFLGSLLLSVVLYFPNSSGSTGFLIFEPWWYIRTMVVSTDKLDWLDLELRRQTYISEDNIKRVIQVEMTAFIIFLFGNLGVRMLGFIDLFKNIRQIFSSNVSLLLVVITLASFIAPMLFLQRGVASNTAQFFQFFILIFGVLTGISLTRMLYKFKSNVLRFIIAVLILLLSTPTQIGLIYNFYKNPPTSKIALSEIEALSYLKTNTTSEDLILTPPYNQYFDQKDRGNTPSIWDWFDTSYVAAFSARRVYFEDYEQVDIMGYDFKKRKELQARVFESEEPDKVSELVVNEDIDYIYFPKLLSPKINLEDAGFERIYENEVSEIWKVI